MPVPLKILNSDAAVDLRWKTNPVGQTKGPGSFITHTLVLSVVYPAVFFSTEAPLQNSEKKYSDYDWFQDGVRNWMCDFDSD